MASIALHLKSNHHCCKPSKTLFTFSHYFSSSSNNDGNAPDKPLNVSSYFNDIKSSLKQQKPYNSANPTSKEASNDVIKRNLAEFRRRSTVPEPQGRGDAQRPAFFSKFYDKNVGNSGGGGGGGKVGNLSFEAIRSSLSQLKEKQGVKGRNVGDKMSLNKYKETFSVTPPVSNVGGRSKGGVIGGSVESLPFNVFGKEIKEEERRKKEAREGGKEGGKEGEEEEDAGSRFELLRMYSHVELGEKLRGLRPESAKLGKKKKGEGEGEGWFSLAELQERVGKLRVIEETETKERLGGICFGELRKSLEAQSSKNASAKRFDILSQPSFSKSPPKEHLVEKYFHPDNMSAAEKLKLELKRVRDEFKMSESDCGSARVQIAQLTTEISHLSSVLHKKDKHSRKGLQAKVQQRKKLLKYLRRTDWDSYCFVLSKLGLRDNPDYKN